MRFPLGGKEKSEIGSVCLSQAGGPDGGCRAVGCPGPVLRHGTVTHRQVLSCGLEPTCRERVDRPGVLGMAMETLYPYGQGLFPIWFIVDLNWTREIWAFHACGRIE